MNPKKLESIKNWAILNNPTEMQKFLGFTGYYRYFIPNYLQIAQPLLHLTKKTTPCVTATGWKQLKDSKM